jgi:hypothetical protein
MPSVPQAGSFGRVHPPLSGAVFSLSKTGTMSQLLQQDSRNSNPVRRPVGGHFTGIADDPVRYSVVPTNMSLPPADTSVDPRTGHPKSAKVNMGELRIDPNQPGIDRIIGGFKFGAQDSYRNHHGPRAPGGPGPDERGPHAHPGQGRVSLCGHGKLNARDVRGQDQIDGHVCPHHSRVRIYRP